MLIFQLIIKMIHYHKVFTFTCNLYLLATCLLATFVSGNTACCWQHFCVWRAFVDFIQATPAQQMRRVAVAEEKLRSRIVPHIGDTGSESRVGGWTWILDVVDLLCELFCILHLSTYRQHFDDTAAKVARRRKSGWCFILLPHNGNASVGTASQ